MNPSTGLISGPLPNRILPALPVAFRSFRPAFPEAGFCSVVMSPRKRTAANGSFMSDNHPTDPDNHHRSDP
ncbi:hypothetical protein NPIL_240271 [Nephila pilipes]|uniref:Uncharacterized protein n=1 Tax=Nephila pilipes TaxID=299642 RepID=A0A8X6KHA4_NEPPI|nr:hypothetical protein NPIL_240271 [Nephila pilipes]